VHYNRKPIYALTSVHHISQTLALLPEFTYFCTKVKRNTHTIMAKVGDTVRYLNAVGGGRIIRIEGNIAVVDDDGFETPVLLRECVVVSTDQNTRMGAAIETPQPSKQAQSQTAPTTPTTQPAVPAEAAIETPGGDSLNVVLGWEAGDLRHIGTSGYDCYLINDSNYYLYFVLMAQRDGEEAWNTIYAGTVEPNIQLLVGEHTSEVVSALDHIRFQALAYKQGRTFQPKTPLDVRINIDATKFFKVHCFRPNEYFDTPVLATALVTNDVPADNAAKRADDTAKALRRALEEKKRADRRPVRRRPIVKTEDNDADPLEVDLHIDSLLDTTAGMSPADILNYQVDTFRRIMDANLRRHGRRIIFIHGKGEGKLRQALIKELEHRYRGQDVQDASFQKYGFGATQVTIR